MVESKALAAIQFFQQRLRQNKVEISKIILFGSQAEGKASAESDVDILLISRSFNNKNIFKRLELIKGPEIATIKKFMIPFDIIMMTPEEFESGTSLVAAYAKRGKVLFAA
jgi:predicted nucleotidyltransferase